MATNAVYDKVGTTVTFTESGGDVVFKLDSDVAAAGDGKASAEWTRGATPQPGLYKWEAFIRFAAAPALGAVVRLYIFDSLVTGKCDIQNGDVTPETLFNNFRLMGQLVTNVAADNTFYASGLVYITGRYVTLGVWNTEATRTFLDTANSCYITLTPVYPDVQAVQ